MTSGRKQKTVIYDLSDLMPCVCGKVIGCFDKCCQWHRVLQLAPRCNSYRRCLDCWDKDYSERVLKSMSGEWVRAQTRLPQSIRDLYDYEMKKYGIKTHWKHDPKPDAFNELKEPMHLYTWPQEFPQVTVAYARHIRGMQPLMDVAAAATPSPPAARAPVSQAGAASSPVVKQEPRDAATVGKISRVLPDGCPPLSKFTKGRDGLYHVFDFTSLTMWTCDDLQSGAITYEKIPVAEHVLPPAPRPQIPRARARARTSTVSVAPPMDADDDDDVVVLDDDPDTPRAKPSGIERWVQETTALTTSTNTLATRVNTRTTASAARTPSTPRKPARGDFTQLSPFLFGEGDEPEETFAFTKGSHGHLKLVARRRSRPGAAGSDTSSGKYSSQPGSYKYQSILPMVWETINPSLCDATPVITTSLAFGHPALDVVAPYDIYGLPMKRSLRRRLKNTVGVLASASEGSLSELATVRATKFNEIKNAPYVNPRDDYVLSHREYYHAALKDSVLEPVSPDDTLTIKMDDLTQLHMMVLQLLRIMNFSMTLGDAEYLLRNRFAALGQLDANLERVLEGREVALKDAFTVANEAFVAVHLLCRDVAIKKAKRELSEAEVIRLRYGPITGTDMYIHPHVLGSVTPERDSSISPSYENQNHPGVETADEEFDAGTPLEDEMEDGELRDTPAGAVTSETVESTPRPAGAVYAPTLASTPPTRRSTLSAADLEQAPASPAAMEQ